MSFVVGFMLMIHGGNEYILCVNINILHIFHNREDTFWNYIYLA